MPNVEDGYTRIANELLDAIVAAQFTAREYAVAMCVIRQTYGFNKPWDDMTLSQIAKKTGIGTTHIGKVVTEMVTRKILLTKPGRFGKNYKFNKHFGQWTYQNGNPMVTKTVTRGGGYRIGKSGLPKGEVRVTKTVSSTHQNGNHKRQSQKTIPKDNPKRHSARERTPPKRRQRICPEDWYPSQADTQAILQQCPNVDQDGETLKFKDHEFETRKSDWSRAWRNWMRNAEKFNRGRRINGANTPTAQTEYERGMALIAEMEAEENAAT